MKNLNQRGFTPFEGVLLVLITASLVFAGYTVWQNNNPADNAIQNNTDKAIKASSAQTNQSPQPQVNYLVIKEWGVKFTLNDAIKDTNLAPYEPLDQSLIITTPRLTELAKTTPGCDGADKSITISRTKVGEDRYGSPWTEAELSKIGTKLNEYYYYHDAGQPCFSDEETAKKYENSIKEIGSIRSNLSKIAETVIVDN